MLGHAWWVIVDVMHRVRDDLPRRLVGAAKSFQSIVSGAYVLLSLKYCAAGPIPWPSCGTHWTPSPLSIVTTPRTLACFDELDSGRISS